MKHPWKQAGLVFGGLLLVTACAGGPDPAPAQDAPDAVAVSDGDAAGLDFDIGALPPQTLEPGECGLFLFAPRPTPRFVFFSNATTGYARMVVEGEQVTLSRSAAAGEVFDQSFSDTSYIAPAFGLELRVRVRPGSEVEGGTEIDSGSLNLARDGGWSVVIPVAGASTCQPG